MDKRKIEKFKQDNDVFTGLATESQKLQQILNSTRVNDAFLVNVEQMLDLEFVIKQKAQLKYLQRKSMLKKDRPFLMNLLSHEYLWSPTYMYYAFALGVYKLTRRRLGFTIIHSLPFLAIPPTMDYFKREHYVKQFPEDQKQLKQTKQTVNQILDEKKQQITFEQVCRFVLHLSLDEPIKKPIRFLPINFD